MKKNLFFFFILTSFFSTARESRLALVIGNSNYTNGVDPLQNPIKDAKLMKDAFLDCGFKIFEDRCFQNMTKKEMMDLIQKFSKEMKNYDIGLIFYAGHGLSANNINYLVPVDFKDDGDLTVNKIKKNISETCVGIEWIKKQLPQGSSKPKHYIIISDACRNNIRQSRNIVNSKTWTSYNSPSTPKTSIITCFSTSEGQQANDNSNYIKAFLKNIRTPGIKILELLKSIRLEMEKIHGQECQVDGQLTIDFYFVAPKKNLNRDKDRDGDMVEDRNDCCPQDSGSIYLKGCPDKDDDGIPDIDDDCINKKGDVLNHGCPVEIQNKIRNFPFFTETYSDLNLDFILVEGGSFTMGCTKEQRPCASEEEPTHDVILSPYYIGKYEVTQKQWRTIMGGDPKVGKNCDGCPVILVSWNDIQKFLEELCKVTNRNYRLPTESEWEYAARGGNKSKGYRFSGDSLMTEVAWSNHNYTIDPSGSDYSDTSPIQEVGHKKPNELNIFDMTGNVMEWCNDWYGVYSRKKQKDPQGCKCGNEKVLRGGGWGDNENVCRISHRMHLDPSDRNNGRGFRLCFSEKKN